MNILLSTVERDENKEKRSWELPIKKPYSIKRSITEWLTSHFTSLDSTKQENLLIIDK